MEILTVNNSSTFLRPAASDMPPASSSPAVEWSSNMSSDCFPVEDDAERMRSSPDMPAWMIATVPLYGIMCTIGVIGNALVVGAVARSATLRSSVTNTYIANLAVSDLCFLSGLPFLMVTVVKQGWIFSEPVCKLFYATTSINWVSSAFTLTVLSADRYLAVCHAVDSRRYRTPKTARAVCIAIWIASSVAMFPVYLGAQTDVMHYDLPCPQQNLTFSGGTEVPPVEPVLTPKWTRETSVSCTLRWPENQLFSAEKAFMWYTFSLSFAFPVGVISVLYALVVLRLRSVGPKRQFGVHQRPDHNHHHHHQQQQSTAMRRSPAIGAADNVLNSSPHLPFESLLSNNRLDAAPIQIELTSGFRHPSPVTFGSNSCRRRPNRRVTLLVLTVIGVYVVCWLPYWVFQVMTLLFDDFPPRWVVSLFQYFTALTYANSAVNPVLYAFHSESFRKTFVASFRADSANACCNGGVVQSSGRMSLFGERLRPGLRSPQVVLLNSNQCNVEKSSSSAAAAAAAAAYHPVSVCDVCNAAAVTIQCQRQSSMTQRRVNLEPHDGSAGKIVSAECCSDQSDDDVGTLRVTSNGEQIQMYLADSHYDAVREATARHLDVDEQQTTV